MFGKLFGKKKGSLSDYSQLAIDMHSHLIPGIDDGAKSLEHSIELCRMLRELGFKKLITTPHAMAEGYRNGPDQILPGLTKLQTALQEYKIDVEVQAAAEYYYDENFKKHLGDKTLLTMGKNFVLFELSFSFPPNDLEQTIFELGIAGYKPILAHPERYPYYAKNGLKDYEDLRNRGVLLQVNLGSFVGLYSKPVQKIARELATAQMIDFLGTDLHNEKHIEVLQEALNDKDVVALVESGTLRNRELSTNA